MPRYDAKRIEAKWQAYWDEHQTFRTSDEIVEGQEKLYVLDMFPYPSANGLHVGHPEGYTATDIICRYSRNRGKNVLHPMGWDAFGLPAEQHAIKTGTHPRITTYRNIDTFRRQLKMLGFSYDWKRELSTTDTEYYRWTQWIFLKLFDTWYDPDCVWTGEDGKERTGRGRPIAELPIPEDVSAEGEEAVRRYQDRNRLAYQHEAPVNWCPALGTVLANEEVIDGKSERGQHPVVRIPLRQWMLRITAYAERLLDDLDDVDWPESIKALQRNWIGRSEGAEVDFFVGSGDADALEQEFANWKAARANDGFPGEPDEQVLRVYTTRPDTLYGATYMVMAPEHPYVDRLTAASQKEAVEAYRQKASTKSDLDRTDLAKEKTGVFTGAHAINPVSGEHVPIWIADYVLVSYGTGAIMAVPAHDLRDWEFAVTFDLPITRVVAPPEGYEPTKDELALQRAVDGVTEFPFSGHGTAINSGDFDGTATGEFKKLITAQLEESGQATAAINYRLRDWLFSRQHFWGEPFPIWHELDEEGQPTGLMRAEDPDSLPVALPEDFDFKPHGRPEPPLAECSDEWLYRTDDDGTRLMRETNSMPQWAGSCWYYIRFTDPDNENQFVDREKEKYWLPVDLYIGGAEHAVLHLLYARFWHKVLFDHSLLTNPEPFRRLVNQGMILGEAEHTGYQSADGSWVSAKMAGESVDESTGEAIRVHRETGDTLTTVSLELEQVEKKGNDFVLVDDPSIAIESRAFKMSKSRGNVINPDSVVEAYGADSLRMYEMFMGPLEQVKPWSMSGVEGVHRFLGRAWRMVADAFADEVKLNEAIQDVEPNEEQERILHKTIKAVTEDIEKLSFNTAISRMMEFTNAYSQFDVRPKSCVSDFIILLSPFAPHIAEEMWQLLGNDSSLAYEPWPEFDESKLVESVVEIPVQVNGKLRARIQVAADAGKNEIESAARAEAESHLDGKNIVKVIVVPGRMVNFVAK